MLIALVLAALVASGDPDGVVTTAPAGGGAVVVGAVAPTAEARPDAAQAARVTPHELTTQEQIDRWLSARAPEVEPFAEAAMGDDRQMHGFVSGSIGTGDYSSMAVGVSLPIGENGRIDLSYSRTENGYGYPDYGYPGGYGYGGYRARPFGASDPFYDGVGRSGRSVAMGFDWDAEREGDGMASPRQGRVGARD